MQNEAPSRKWRRINGNAMRDIHIIPIDDLKEHEHSDQCWCRPARDSEENRVVVHNSLDGREQYETGERQMH